MAKQVVIATIRVDAGRMDEYMPMLMTLRERSLQEQPGTLHYDVLLSHESENVLVAYGVFTDREAIERFENGAPMAWIEEASDGIDREISLQHFDLLE